MADYTITDLPRELTDDEAARMTSLASDLFRQFELEREQPTHLCTKVHGGKLVVDKVGNPVHQHQPRCHDCGRGLHRPPGNDDVTWLCLNARQVLPAGAPDSAVECGEKG